MTDARKAFLDKAHPLAESLIDYALTAGKKFGITDARVVVSSSKQEENAVEKGALIKTVSGAGFTVSVTLYAGDRQLSFTKNTSDDANLRAAMLENMAVIHLVPGNKYTRLLEKEKVYQGPVNDLDLYDTAPPSHEQLVDYATKMEAAAMAVPGAKGVRSVGITRQDGHRLILATNGLDLAESATSYTAAASVIAEDKSGMQINYDYSIARHFSDMARPQDLGRQAAETAVAKLGCILPQTGDVPIVLSPDAAATFFASVLAAIEGTAVYRGTTYMKDHLGQQVLNKGITIVDDPTIKGARGSVAVDSAGIEAKPITLVEDGVLKGFLVDLQEARQLGIEPIGRENGPTNVSVLPGTLSPEDLIADIKDGIYIDDFSGGDADVNTGIHSRGGSGRLIKDGKITNIAVDGFIVAGNLKELFMDAVIANDTPEHPHTRYTLAAPTTRINKATIAGK